MRRPCPGGLPFVRSCSRPTMVGLRMEAKVPIVDTAAITNRPRGLWRRLLAAVQKIAIAEKLPT